MMAITAALGATVFTGCGKSEEEGDHLPKEEHAALHRDNKGDNPKTNAESIAPLREVASLPKDFALEYTTRTAGVLPSDERFIMVKPDASNGFLLTAGQVKYDAGSRQFVESVRLQKTEEQCLTLYNEARMAGFFGLRDRYEEMEAGGIGTTVKITSNGSTKTVRVYGTQVKEFDVVVSAIQKLSR